MFKFSKKKKDVSETDVFLSELNFELGDSEEYTPPAKIKVLPASPITGMNERVYHWSGQVILDEFQKNELQIPIDINHATVLKAMAGEPSPAMGWISNLEVQLNSEGSEEIWGTVEWNYAYPLKYKEYKYYSPELKSNYKGEISRIGSVGLVNKPNFKVSALNFENNNEEEEKINMDNDILKALDLPEGTSKDGVLQKIHTVNTELKAKVTSLNSEHNVAALVEDNNKLTQELNALKTGILNEKKVVAVEEAVKGGKISPATKEYYISTLNSEDALVQFVDVMSKAPSFMGEAIKTPKLEEGTSLNFEQKKEFEKYGISEEEYKKRKAELFNN